MSEEIQFDLALFQRLNEEYKEKPIVPQPISAEPQQVDSRGLKRAKKLQDDFNIAGKRVLEIGCGRGESAYSLAEEFGCEVCGVDVNLEHYGSWWDERQHPNLTLRNLDISTEDYSDLGRFDFIYSYVVWEHITHPYSALKAAKELLNRNGRMFIVANLYRGPQASHRYREVYFPWPHLLFTDAVFQDFYAANYPDGPRRKASWVNKLTAAQYLTYFDILDLHVDNLSYQKSPIDEDFYQRFHDVLSRYPRFDLERDFMRVTLTHSTMRRTIATAARRKLASSKPFRWIKKRVRRR